ncbi:hypothetical protein PCASD_03849 [Puccinia coronata f. sp. avenae]|uniref:Uncharacterized protein n=1 Tax=Puccinia coronata f. sp. avenae TaxID=200324 RepID=A0A2N5V2W8_9BASI|nr:hypothetical protein PCASD_03849 [Puccinia coronata f. sp. avenae]
MQKHMLVSRVNDIKTAVEDGGLAIHGAGSLGATSDLGKMDSASLRLEHVGQDSDVHFQPPPDKSFWQKPVKKLSSGIDSIKALRTPHRHKKWRWSSKTQATCSARYRSGPASGMKRTIACWDKYAEGNMGAAFRKQNRSQQMDAEEYMLMVKRSCSTNAWMLIRNRWPSSCLSGLAPACLLLLLSGIILL